MDLSATHDVPRRRLLTVTGVTGIAFTLSWISRAVRPGAQPQAHRLRHEIVAALAGHGTAVAAQFALTEGLPAAGLASFRSPWPGPRAGPERPRPPGSPSSPALRPRSSRWSSSCSVSSSQARPLPAPPTCCMRR